MQERNVERPDDQGDGEALVPGRRVWGRGLDELGLVLGWRTRACACGRADRVAVLWPDGEVTWCCPRGMRLEGGRWRIGR